MSDLVTLSDVKAALGITGDAQDGQINFLLAGADDMVAAYCGRAIRQAALVEYHDGGGPTITVTSWPVAASPALVVTDRVTGSVVSADTYDLDLTKGQISLRPAYGTFWRGHRRYQVAYTGGWTAGTVPGAIKAGIAKIIEAHMRAAGLVSESDHGYSYTVEQIASQGGIPATARPYLDRYRNY